MHRKLFMYLSILIIAGNAAMQSAGAKEPAPSGERPKPDQIKDEIGLALDETTTMEFVETSLQDVIDYLKDLHKQKHRNFDIVFDIKSLSDLGITPETTITKSLKGIPLRSALRLMLRDLGLSYVVRNDVLLITSPEEACYIKVYDVADLVSAKEGEKNTALDSLLRMIAKSCPLSAPSGKSGWPGWIESLRSAEVTAIVVNQPGEFQDEVADLLTQLRAVRHPK